VLVHIKVRAGGIDVTVHSSDRELTASASSLLQSALSA
jgi:hypothetical protein